MTPTPPDPRADAKVEADELNANRDLLLYLPVRQVLEHCDWLDGPTLVAAVTEYHACRMACIPDPAAYPDSPAWVEYVRQRDSALLELTGMEPRDLAIHRSLAAYMTFRGHGGRPDDLGEHCRIAYLPDTDRGEMHIKNVDDVIDRWTPAGDMPATLPNADELVWDDVASGLHLDDEPADLFPLPIRRMCLTMFNDVPSATQFLSRYSPFWGACNVILHDRRHRSVMIEKCSRNHIQIHSPDASGRSYVSGMVCRNRHSPIGQYQRDKRRAYLRLFDLPDNGADATYWRICEEMDHMLADVICTPGPVHFDDVIEVFINAWPDGLNKAGAKVHREQKIDEYTVMTHLTLLTERRYMRWQRSKDGKHFPEKPESARY